MKVFGEVQAPRGIQKVLTGLLEKAAFVRIKSSSDVHKSFVQRLVSAASKNAGSWLSATPTTPELTLFDNEFIYAFRHWLGLPPHDDLPPYCACGADLKQDKAHFHSCQLLLRGPITVRHDRLVKMLAKELLRVRRLNTARLTRSVSGLI